MSSVAHRQDDNKPDRWLVGDYHYGSCVLDGERYAIIKNGNVIERIRAIQSDGNPVIWQDGDQMTNLVLQIMASIEVVPQV